jgi:hypothetical protein
VAFGYERTDPAKLAQIDVLAYLIRTGPGRTEAQLAEAIHGNAAYQQRVNQDCRMLADGDLVERRGDGGPSDPYRYFPKV